MNSPVRRTCVRISIPVALTLFSCACAWGHCDGLDGPVVGAARRALETGDVTAALIWVREDGEAEVRTAFEKALAVRKLSAEARDLADRYFFETLVRVHRSGEGEPYTGLKPAGRDLGPAVPAADKAVETQSSEPVIKVLWPAIREGVERRFSEVIKAKEHAAKDVQRGRDYVRAYVGFIHYVERTYELAASGARQAHEAGHAADGHAHE